MLTAFKQLFYCRRQNHPKDRRGQHWSQLFRGMYGLVSVSLGPRIYFHHMRHTLLSALTRHPSVGVFILYQVDTAQ